MKRFMSLFLIFSLVTINCASLRTTGGKREKHGATLIITKKDGQHITGELVTVKIPQQSLMLLGSETGADISVDIKDIKLITILRISKAGVAFLVGGCLGALWGLVAYEEGNFFDFGRGGDAVTGAIFGGLIGLAFYGKVKVDKTIQIEGKSGTEIAKLLVKLRRKARVRDYK